MLSCFKSQFCRTRSWTKDKINILWKTQMVVAVTGEKLAAAQRVHSSLPGAHPEWETVTYSHSCDLGKVYISSLCSFLWNSQRYMWLKQRILSRLACSGTWFTVLSFSHLFTQALFTPPTSHSPETQISLPGSTRLSFPLHIEHRNPRLPSQAPFSHCTHVWLLLLSFPLVF